MDIRTLTLNENAIIDSLIERMQLIYEEVIVNPLGSIAAESVQDFLQTNINEAIDLITLEVEDHLKAILQLEIFRGVQLVELNPVELEYFFNRFIAESRYPIMLENLKIRLAEKLQNSAREAYGRGLSREEFQTIAIEAGYSEIHSMERIAIAEGVAATNQGKAMYYEAQDDYGEYEYYWSVHRDRRTSPQCKAIERRVNQRGGAVPLEELKSIIRDVALEMDASYPYRDYSPHYYCRSSLVRRV